MRQSTPFALLFPGQGAQFVGMGKEVHDSYPMARALFETADQILGFSVKSLCFEGPEDTLNLTINAQPAIFVTSLAIWEAIQCEYGGLVPEVACGLSLGEFSALVAVGSITFEDGLRLVRKRGQFMHECGLRNPGAMCSVIGLDAEACEFIATSCGIQVANYNAPDQTVLSGKSDAVEQAMRLGRDKGAKKVIPLKVSGAFHSSLMAEARVALGHALAAITLRQPRRGFIPNVTGSIFAGDPEEIRSLLARQVTSPVRWTQTIDAIADMGLSHGLEMGPGRVLRGLAKRIRDGFQVHSIEIPLDVKKIHAFWNSEED